MDLFIEQYGTIFSTRKWLDLIGESYRIHKLTKGNEIIGCFIDCGKVDVKLTPYHGIIAKHEYTVAKHFSDFSGFVNHYSFPDIRPFLWKGHKPVARYTYVVNGNTPDKDTRYLINKCQSEVRPGTIDEFWDIYKETFDRKKLNLPVDHQWLKDFDRLFTPRILICGGSGVVMMSDTHRDYYIFGASRLEALNTGSSAKALHKAITRETDLVGCNNEKVGLFKRGFRGEIKVCIGAE
jgi:hypothetical protein